VPSLSVPLAHEAALQMELEGEVPEPPQLEPQPERTAGRQALELEM
jgi:hypothetical protein